MVRIVNKRKDDRRQQQSLILGIVLREWRVINLSGSCIHHRHHLAGRTTSPRDDDIVASEIWTRLLAPLSKNTCPFADSLPNAGPEGSFFSSNQSRICRCAGENLCCRIVLKSWSGSGLCHGGICASDNCQKRLGDGMCLAGTCHANNFDRILPATSFPRSPTSPIGPTQLGHPDWHLHDASRLAAPSINRRRNPYNAALCPIPPG